MTQQSGMPTVLRKNPGVSKSGSKGPNALFWLQGYLHTSFIYTDAYIHINKINQRSFLNLKKKGRTGS